MIVFSSRFDSNWDAYRGSHVFNGHVYYPLHSKWGCPGFICHGLYAPISLPSFPGTDKTLDLHTMIMFIIVSPTSSCMLILDLDARLLSDLGAMLHCVHQR